VRPDVACKPHRHRAATAARVDITLASSQPGGEIDPLALAAAGRSADPADGVQHQVPETIEVECRRYERVWSVSEADAEVDIMHLSEGITSPLA
jgi:hypothetical protein